MALIPEVINILGLKFSAYGLIVALAVSLLYIMTRSTLESKKYTEKELDLMLLLTFPLGIIGGRLFFVALNWQYFITQSFTYVVAVWQGGIHIFGVFAGVLVGLSILSKYIKKNMWEISDSLVLFLPLAQSIGRLGNFVNSELFGPPTNLPWGIFIPLSKRPLIYMQNEFFHPLFAYEAILNLINFAILWLIAKNTSKNMVKNPGSMTAIYIINYALIRFFMEFLRLDYNPTFAGLRVVQWVCILAFTIAIIMMKVSLSKTSKIKTSL